MDLLDDTLVGLGQFLGRGLVGVLRLGQERADGDVTFHPAAELAHQFLGCLVNLGDVLLLVRLLPCHLDHIQNYHESHLAHDQHIVVLGHLPEHRILLQHKPERPLDRDEHQIVVHFPPPFRNIRGVVLGLKLVHMLADALDMGLGEPYSILHLLRVDIFLVRVQTDL